MILHNLLKSYIQVLINDSSDINSQMVGPPTQEDMSGGYDFMKQ